MTATSADWKAAHDGLCRAMIERPFDDLPRQAYADLLDDSGDAQLAERAGAVRDGLAHPERVAWYGSWDNKAQFFLRRGFLELLVTDWATFRDAANRLFTSYPITEVRFTDLRPMPVPHMGNPPPVGTLARDWRGQWVFEWRRQGGRYAGFAAVHRLATEHDGWTCQLPGELAARMDGGTMPYATNCHWAFDTEPDAQAALSAAALGHGRGVAGLPKIDVPRGRAYWAGVAGEAVESANV